MSENPSGLFEFTYRHQGRTFALDIPGNSRADAEARLADIAKAKCIGELELLANEPANKILP